MSREDLLTRILEFASRAYNKPVAEIHESTRISEELGVQSMQRVAFSAAIENEFDVMIPVARIGRFETIGEVADYVMDEM